MKISALHWPALDGVRGVAVLLVLLSHVSLPFLTTASGTVGVDMFFVLSGFLITGILSREIVSFGQLSFKNFYARRALRLAPALVLTCLFVLLFSPDTHLPDIGVVLAYSANWVKAFGSMSLGDLGHCWSLACEEQFYFFWPLVIVALERTKLTTLQKGGLLFGFSTLMALHRVALTSPDSLHRIYFALDSHMDGLMLGAALSYFLSSPTAAKFSKPLQVVLPLAGLPILYFITHYTIDSVEMGVFGYWWSAVFGALLIASVMLSRHSLVAQVLSLRPLVYCGKISYGLYLLHYPIYHLADNHLAFLRAWHALAVVKIVLSLGVAALSFHLVEQRFLRLKKYFVTEKKAVMTEKLSPVCS